MKKGLSWDEPLPTPFEDHRSQVVPVMANISTLCVPRCCGPPSHDFKVEVHVFTDALVHAYSAAAYLLVTGSSSVQSNLIYYNYF